MIKNIIFDMGGVLVRFDPKTFVARYLLPREEETLLLKEVFRSLEWAQLDRGTISEDEAVAAICRRVPGHLHEIARKLVTMWDRPILPIEGMSGLIAELKERGLGIYLLSNASTRLHDYWPRIPGHERFGGMIVSADLKLVKPQPEIYRALYDAFGLKPEECFFIDDSPQNIEGAFYTGMSGFVFNGDVQALRRYLSEQGIL